MSHKESFYPESRFGGFTDTDGSSLFYLRVHALLAPDAVVVDLGCGRGAYDEDPVSTRRELRILKGENRRVIGLDTDEAAEKNPFLDEFHLLDGPAWPLPDDSVDMVVCDFVMEHLDQPENFFSEARRVLRDGGHLCLRTANAWNYIALAARLVPNRHHARVLTQVQEQRKEEDVFPTRYRCNTLGKLRAALDRHGFDHAVYGFDAEPSYLAFSKFFYRLGVLYQRLAPGFLRSTIFAFAVLRKDPRQG